MRYTLRLFSFVVAAACGLSAAPIQGADGTLRREPATATLSDAQAWSLRRSRAAMMGAARPLSEMPNERRAVRVVYDGYGEARLLRSSY